jgi:hypothetical protein
MSLLQQDSNIQDDASRGEEFTKGTSRIGIAAIIATVVVALAIAAYVITGQKGPVASGEVTGVTAHMVHRETSAFDAGGAPKPKDIFDQLLLFSHLKVQNLGKEPITVHDIMANITLPDGIHSANAASPYDYERLFQFMPDLNPLHGKSLPLETTLSPGQAIEGDVIMSFRMTKEEWDTHKNLDFSVAIPYQDTVKITPKGPVTVR